MLSCKHSPFKSCILLSVILMCSGIKFSKYYNLKLQLKNPENAIICDN